MASSLQSKFGRKILEKYGWSDGKGLGVNEDGRKTHIQNSAKRDRHGIGLETKAVTDIWWERLYNSASQSLQVKADKVSQSSESDAASDSDQDEQDHDIISSTNKAGKRGMKCDDGETLAESNSPENTTEEHVHGDESDSILKEEKKKRKKKRKTKDVIHEEPSEQTHVEDVKDLDLGKKKKQKKHNRKIEEKNDDQDSRDRHASSSMKDNEVQDHEETQQQEIQTLQDHHVQARTFAQYSGIGFVKSDGVLVDGVIMQATKPSNDSAQATKKASPRVEINHVDARKLAEDSEQLQVDVLNAGGHSLVEKFEKRTFGMHGNVRQLGKLERLAMQEKGFRKK